MFWKRRKPPIVEPPKLVIDPYVLRRFGGVWMKLVPWYGSGPITTWKLSLDQARQLIDHAFDPSEEGYPKDLPYLRNKVSSLVIHDLVDTLRRLLQEKTAA